MTGGGFEKMKRMIEIVNHLSYGKVLSSSELGRLCGVSRKAVFLDKKIEESEGHDREMFESIKDRFSIKRF